jgi:agmatine deiminase
MKQPTNRDDVGTAVARRLPAEWKRHGATWLGWPPPLNRDWPGKLQAAEWAFAEIARKLTPGETVRMLVADRRHAAKARRMLAAAGADLSCVEMIPCPTDRNWTRDMGPMFVRGSKGEWAVLEGHFNGWGWHCGAHGRDRLVARRMARRLGLPLVAVLAAERPGEPPSRRVVLEGGAVDVNGQGTLVTTEECLLDQRRQARNPGLGREATERALRDYLGAINVLWLGRGIAGDDTHGHVDDLCRFVDARTLVLAQEPDAREANHRPLAENRERLEDARLENGSRPEVVALPMPAPLFFGGRRLPASYANFYIANAAVLVPTFNDPKDRLALGILGELFHDRPVVGIHAVDLVLGRGSIHCLTQQEPEGVRAKKAGQRSRSAR